MIRVIKCGYESRHKTKFQLIRKTGVPNYILLMVKSKALFRINDKLIETNPNMVILFDRNTPTDYGSVDDFFNNDWIHFDFMGEVSIFETLHIPFNEPIYLSRMPMLSNYVRLLVQENHSPSLHKLQIQDALMRLILYSLDTQVTDHSMSLEESRYRQALNQLRLDIHNTPHKKWTAEYMAASVHLSLSYFQHLYKKTYHITCMQEVIQARIERAKFYLSTTDIPVKTVADFCGYENQMHFIRQFKMKEGLTPSQYRQLCQDSNNASADGQGNA